MDDRQLFAVFKSEAIYLECDNNSLRKEFIAYHQRNGTDKSSLASHNSRMSPLSPTAPPPTPHHAPTPQYIDATALESHIQI